MITSFILRFGRAPGLPADRIPATPVTVFVGPNNSGKSKVLAELASFCASGQTRLDDVILADAEFKGLDAAAASQAISHLTLAPKLNEAVHPGHVYIGSRGQRTHVPKDQLHSFIESPATNLQAFCSWFLKHSILKLDGASRINLVNDQAGGDLQETAQTSLQVLFSDDTRRAEVRRIVNDAFGSYFVVDPTRLGHLRIRLSDRPPSHPNEERSLDRDAVEFHRAAKPISTASDGVKAFTGIVTEVIAGDPRVLLIDEPEAFLHPSLASLLGLELSRAALKSEKRVYVSTHSPYFVMGCIQSGAPVTIIRLTYRNGVATARVLPSDEILELMRNPLLRSTGVLTGLFYEFVVVTESDADRAFYQEINERLVRSKPEWGIPNCLFINAQNKQTVHTILRPLRKLGIPAAAIVDIDVLKEGGTNWTNVLGGAHLPPLENQALSVHRAAIKEAMIATGKDMKRDGGVSILDASEREAAMNLLRSLAAYGVFIVPGGELESWLKTLGASHHGPAWLVDIFERIGADPDAADYVRPADDDVWQFMSTLKEWFANPNRKGIPD